MQRIRTIKPSFFTSDDIVELEPIARLFYIALWCEADREGRLELKPRMLKRAYFADDQFDVSRVVDALVTRGLLVRYTVENIDYGWIPTFTKHQHINGRESASILPAPPAKTSLIEPKKSTRRSRVNDASAHVDHASARDTPGREWKGMEGNGIGGLQVLTSTTSFSTKPGAQEKSNESPPPKTPDDLLTQKTNGNGRGPRHGLSKIGEVIGEESEEVAAKRRQIAEQARMLGVEP